MREKKTGRWCNHTSQRHGSQSKWNFMTFSPTAKANGAFSRCALVQAPGQVQRGSGEGAEGSGEGLEGFGAGPSQVQQGSGEGSREGSGEGLRLWCRARSGSTGFRKRFRRRCGRLWCKAICQQWSAKHNQNRNTWRKSTSYVLFSSLICTLGRNMQNRLNDLVSYFSTSGTCQLDLRIFWDTSLVQVHAK